VLSQGKSGEIIGEQIVDQTVHDLLAAYAAQLGFENLAPHDLRRTFAKLARKGGAGLEQLQAALGHASISTTERYLGEMQDFTEVPGERLGVRLKG
jgi:integrase/recombinase XerD